MIFFSFALDFILIGLLSAGIFYAVRLTRQLADMGAHRLEMARFVQAFNETVARAEAGVKNLKSAARSSGDDLEKLIEKGRTLADELHFLTSSADQAAERVSASLASRPSPLRNPQETPHAFEEEAPPPTKTHSDKAERSGFPPSSAAERNLMRALGKR